MLQIKPIIDEKQMSLTDIYKKLAMAEEQIADNQLLDGDEVFAKLRSKYGNKI